MPRPEELRLTEFGSEESDYDEDIFSNSIIHRYEKKKARCSKRKLCGGTMLGMTVIFTAVIVTLTLYPFSLASCDTSTGFLSGHIIPIHYDLWLHPNLTTLTFEGKVEIHFEVVNKTQCIVLNSLEQNITGIQLRQKSTGKLHITEKFTTIPELEFITIPLRAAIEVGKYVLIVRYKADVRHGLKGFYRSYYTTSEGVQRVAAVTQFEATYARHAFPCFDEPQYKATFTISVVRDPEHTVLSNMPKNKTAEYGDTGLFQDSFQKSVKMSTYLVAFMVMDFTSRSTTTSTGKTIRIWSRSETHHQTEYALDCAVQLMEYYEKTFGIPFPLPKQDLVAVPDFNSGAMENWGLITYRETSILYDPEGTSNTFKRRVLSVVAHEMAHQWFGNLVTMEWWNDLWLNEGFASYMEYVASDVVNPEMGMQMYLQKNGMQRALSADSFSNSHAISSEANTPESIAQMFDAISYRKGACIIRMLNEVLGDVKFFEGINLYLKRYEYSNAKQSQLYDAINETANHMDSPIDVSGFMNSWTLQMGYPIVYVKLIGENRVKISQSKYKFPGEEEVTSPFGYIWQIPFWYQSNQSDKSSFVWLSDESLEFDVEDNTNWILGNSLARGFYRVTYDAENWAEIIDILHNNHEVFHEVDRMKIIDDLTSISQVLDEVDITWALEASTYLKKEKSLYSLTGSLTSLSRIVGKLSVLEEYEEAIDAYYLHILVPVVERIGLEPKQNDTFITGMFRGAVLSDAAQHGHRPSIEYAKKLYDDHVTTGKEVEANLFEFVYNTVALTCSEEVWESILQEYTHESLQSKQRYLMKALASTADIKIIKKLLRYTMDESKVRQQDARIVLMYISMGSFEANKETFNFVRENWDYFYSTYGHSNTGFDLLMQTVIGQFYSTDDLDEVKKFFDNKEDLGSIDRGVKKGREAAQHRLDWLNKHEDRAGGWFKDNFPKH